MAGRPVVARRTRRWSRSAILTIAGMGAGMPWAQAPDTGGQPSIYTCITPQGRRITSDRPIAECMGTGQRELSSGGSLKRIVPPVLTASERAREAERLRQEAARQSQLDEEKRKAHALVTRYPDQAAHDQARREALGQIDGMIAVMRKRQARLDGQQDEIAAELEFYQRAPDRAPAWLRKQAEENQRQIKALAARLAESLRERERIVKAFDDELLRLQQLWQQELR